MASYEKEKLNYLMTTPEVVEAYDTEAEANAAAERLNRL